VLARPHQSPGTELLCRRRDESGDHGQCQHAKVAAAHLIEIAFEPAQVVPVMVDRAWAKASLFAKDTRRTRVPARQTGWPTLLLGAVLTLRYDQTKEMPDGATREIAVASPRIGWPVQAPSRQPVDDERVEKRLRPLDAVSIARAANSANSIKMGPAEEMLRAAYPRSHRAVT